MNDLDNFRNIFSSARPYAGTPPKGFVVDFLGTLTDFEFRKPSGDDPNLANGEFVQTSLPNLERDGEGWFEAVNWFLSAKESKKPTYIMLTLGACYGGQAVGAAAALRLLNPKPMKLVAVEPEPTNIEWTKKHFADNGIHSNEYWIVPFALGANCDPIMFPIGSPGSGAQNSFSTNELAARKDYFNHFRKSGRIEEALENILLNNRTGIHKLLVEGTTFNSEIQILSGMDLNFLLEAFDYVDFIESDLQQSEIIVLPPSRKKLKEKVKRIHIGTHGKDVHKELHKMFEKDGWQIEFSFEPNSINHTQYGKFTLNDGVLTLVNNQL